MKGRRLSFGGSAPKRTSLHSRKERGNVRAARPESLGKLGTGSFVRAKDALSQDEVGNKKAAVKGRVLVISLYFYYSISQ